MTRSMRRDLKARPCWCARPDRVAWPGRCVRLISRRQCILRARTRRAEETQSPAAMRRAIVTAAGGGDVRSWS